MTKAEEWEKLKKTELVDVLSKEEIYTQGWLDGIRFIQDSQESV